MTNTITAMIVDDEPLAREGLLMRLQATNIVTVICSCASADEAKLAIAKFTPEVIFLDIEMPGMSGIEFAQWLQINMEGQCKVIFVTAFREFALSAFEFEAFDYLLKPFAEDRFEACISKLVKARGEHEAAQKHHELDELLVSKTGYSLGKFMKKLEVAEPGKLNQAYKTISLKSGTQWLRIEVDSIFWIEAAGDYMCLHTQEGTQIIRKTLKQLEDELDESQFLRVSRSAIVNVDKLVKLTPNSNGEYIATLASGDSVKVSRKYKFQLSELN